MDLVLENASQEHKCKTQRLRHLAVMKSEMYDEVIETKILVLPTCDEIACLIYKTPRVIARAAQPGSDGSSSESSNHSRPKKRPRKSKNHT